MFITWRLQPLLLLLLFVLLQMTEAIWFPWYFRRYGFDPHGSRRGGARPHEQTQSEGPAKTNRGGCPPGYELRDGGKGTATCPPGYEMKGNPGQLAASFSRLCDDNQMVMQLARLYVVSPERIVLLLSQPVVADSCQEITDVLDRIVAITSNCIVADDNIYGKLAAGLQFFKSEMCDGSNRRRQALLNEAHSCLKELRTDMIECEAPADWYERSNATKVCQTFNDVLDCYYTRTALLCGLEAARQLRSFAGDSMNRAMIHNCEVNKRLPRVTDPMPAFFFGASPSNSCNVLLTMSSFIIFLIF